MEQELVLILSKAFENQLTEGWPIKGGKTMFNCLQPTFGRTNELHSGSFDPNRRVHKVHLKIILGIGNPELGTIPIKLWKMHLRKFTES